MPQHARTGFLPDDARASDRASTTSSAGATVEDHVSALGRRDMETAQRMIDRHVIMDGVAIPTANVPDRDSDGTSRAAAL
jgi:hypothetical protein